MSIDVRGLAPLLQVFDMAASLRFYRDVLGCSLTSSAGPGDGAWALLTLNGIELMLNTAYDDGERPAVPDPARVAAHSDTILYFSVPDVDAVYEQLRIKGVALAPPKNAPYRMRQLHLSDPDGYRLCFQWPV